MFRKLAKFLLSLTLISGIIAAIYYFCKGKSSDEMNEDDFSEDMDSLDLDHDLEPMSDREYVSLNRTVAEEPATDASEKTVETDNTPESDETSDADEVSK